MLIQHDVPPDQFDNKESNCSDLPSDLPDLISIDDSDAALHLDLPDLTSNDDDSNAESTTDERPLGLFWLFLTGEPTTSRPMTSFDLLLCWLADFPTLTSSDCGNSDLDELD